MNLLMDKSLIDNYKSKSQQARVLTETWFLNNMFCPRCGNKTIHKFNNNRPVADFFCSNCSNEYELKSKSGNFLDKVNDGAYSTMIERINSNSNPDFFFLSYSLRDYSVNNLILIPKHFFVPEIIEKRNPLSQTAKRAGWIGCNINLTTVPDQGKIHIVQNGNINLHSDVIRKRLASDDFMTKNIKNRGWLLDILNCMNQIPTSEFTLKEIYHFKNQLILKHPTNNNIEAKIRQQLQFLRDKGFIQFLGNGKYKKIAR